MTLYDDLVTTLEAYNVGLAAGLQASGFESVSLTDGAVLTQVIDAPKSMVQIATARRVSKQAVQSQVQSLYKRGLVEIKPDANDGRIRLVQPSQTGRRLVAALTEIQANLDAQIESKLGTERLKNFRNMLGQVTSSLPQST